MADTHTFGTYPQMQQTLRFSRTNWGRTVSMLYGRICFVPD